MIEAYKRILVTTGIDNTAISHATTHLPSLRALELREHGSFVSFHFAESGFELGHAHVLFRFTVTVDVVDSPHHVPIYYNTKKIRFHPPKLLCSVVQIIYLNGNSLSWGSVRLTRFRILSSSLPFNTIMSHFDSTSTECSNISWRSVS